MTSSSKTTTDHNEIRKWAEARGGKPAIVKRTESDDDVGILRIDFPGDAGAGSLEEITWDEFFHKFDEKNLAFLYQDKTSSGEESRFFELTSRDTAEHKSHPTQQTDDKHESKSHGKTDKAEGKHETKAHKADNKSESKSHKSESKSHK